MKGLTLARRGVLLIALATAASAAWAQDKATWRTNSAHRPAQQAGRGGIFADYRLRVASVVRDYGMNERAQAPEDSRAVHDEKAAL